MNYRVVEASDIRFLVQQVEMFIAQGWKPQGGLCVDENGFYQAMVREKS
jgi:hypothetical protein